MPEYTNAFHGVTTKVCQDCGAVVADTVRHDRFHELMNMPFEFRMLAELVGGSGDSHGEDGS